MQANKGNNSKTKFHLIEVDPVSPKDAGKSGYYLLRPLHEQLKVHPGITAKNPRASLHMVDHFRDFAGR